MVWHDFSVGMVTLKVAYANNNTNKINVMSNAFLVNVKFNI